METCKFKTDLNRKTVGEQIVQSLRNAIISGDLSEGEALTESSLSKQLGTSRSPVREAMQQLRRERLITIGPNRAMIVASLELNDIDELYEFRIVLEKFAMIKICQMDEANRLSIAHKLTQVLNEMRDAISKAENYAISTVDLKFHKTLVEASDNSRVIQTYRDLSLEFLTLINRLEVNLPSGQELIEDHKKLLAAVQDGDQNQGIALIEGHLHSAAVNLKKTSGERSRKK